MFIVFTILTILVTSISIRPFLRPVDAVKEGIFPDYYQVSIYLGTYIHSPYHRFGKKAGLLISCIKYFSLKLLCAEFQRRKASILRLKDIQRIALYGAIAAILKTKQLCKFMFINMCVQLKM